MNTLNNISNLPQAVRNHIGTYNPEHREQMTKVLRQLVYTMCATCDEYIPPQKLLKKFNQRSHIKYCSHWCLEADYMDHCEHMFQVDYGYNRRYVHSI